MTAGKGYIIRGPQSYVGDGYPKTYEASFTGIPNNGDFTAAIGNTGTVNLIGNPYPSALDAESFLTVNTGIGHFIFGHTILILVQMFLILVPVSMPILRMIMQRIIVLEELLIKHLAPKIQVR